MMRTIEGALGRTVDRRMTIGIVDADRVVRLDIALMNHGGVELALDNEVRELKPLREIAAIELQMIGDVGRLIRAIFFIAQSGSTIGAPVPSPDRRS